MPEAKAKLAVETVLKFIKDKLPEPIAGQIDTVFEGGSLPTDLMGSLGSLLGGKK